MDLIDNLIDNLINNLINELKTSNKIFIPSIVKEINLFVLNKLLNFYQIYKNNSCKYELLSNLANFGLELENVNNISNNDILSIQMNFLVELFSPIINRIRKICYEINLELIIEYKNFLFNLIESKPIKYQEQKKNIKFIQINIFCRNSNYILAKDILFEDFGITIKITNYHFKDIFNDLIVSTNFFIQNNNNKDKRFDWFWKAINHKNNLCINNSDLSCDNENIKSNDIYNENYETNNNEIIESFKIIQQIPDLNKIKFQSIHPQNLNTKSIKSNEMLKNISNSIIIEDESFSIPIENIDILSTI